jgi:hypothetical protein
MKYSKAPSSGKGVGSLSRQCAMVCAFFLASTCFSTTLSARRSEDLPDAISGGTQLADNTAPAADSLPARDDVKPQQPLLPETLTFSDRLKLYEHSFISPESIVGPLFGAGIAQAEGSPHEWGGGMEGYGRRFASSYGRSVIGRTIALGVSSVDGEDARYHRSTETGAWKRTKHAVLATFISTNSNGGSMPAYSRFAGAYGAGFIANAWEPPSQYGTGHALERGSFSILSSVGFHVFQEFWPDIRGAIHH